MGEKDIQSGDDGLRTNPGSEQRISTNQIMILWPQILQLSSSPLLYFFSGIIWRTSIIFSLWKKPPAMTDCLVVGHFGVTGSNSSNSIQRELFKMYFYQLYSSSFVFTVFAIHLYRADKFHRNLMRRRYMYTSTVFNNLHPNWINPPFHCITPQYLLYLWIYTYLRLRDGLIWLTINICLLIQKTSKLLQ